MEKSISMENSVKLTSPRIKYMVCSGAMVISASLILYGIYEMNKSAWKNSVIATTLCELRKWLLPAGFTAAYAALVLKTFRIYLIYSSVIAKPRRKELGTEDHRKVEEQSIDQDPSH
ncbi:Gamma-aminobutyric acid type B receptor subunit 2 [Trichoplax sp. H2]|nr:Gamma-aminobutyric acid type B receptor subunit 2 [Trichoplax sp. H2]|eukprot:RDD43833.1 Gamma-aminobutyric acid type B receptor subunit 2 [Trichoplax sp. H2]